MANIILPRGELTPELRRDVITAVNDLKDQGALDRDAHYTFSKRRGEWGVEIWKGERMHPVGGIVWAKATDVCAAVKPSVIRGAFLL